MALIMMDGFDTYNGISELPPGGRWQSVSNATIDASFARSQGKGLAVNNGGQVYSLNYPLTQTMVMGCAVYFAGTTVENSFFHGYDTGSLQVYLSRKTDGTLVIRRGDGTALATSVSTVNLNTWYYIEFKFTIHNSTGAAEVWVDGTSYASVSGADTQQTASAGTTFVLLTGASNANPTNYFDDFYLLDDSGSAPLNDRLGDVRCVPVAPSKAGSATDWQSNSFANHRAVAYNQDNDSSFTEAGTPNDTDLFDYEDAPFDAGTIYAVHTVTTARRGVDALHDFCPVTKSGGTVYEGTVSSLPTSYTTIIEIYEEDPDTSAPWSVSGLNAAEFGYRLKT